MAITPQTVVEAVERASGGRSIREIARELGVGKNIVERFLRGERTLEPDPLYVAIYRKYPQLRWLLEEFQRKAALAPDEEAGTVPSARRG